MTVHERIAEAVKIIAEIEFEKSGKVMGANYTFIPIGQILQAVRKAHSAAGLFLTTGPLEFDTSVGEGITTDSRGWNYATGHCEVSLNGADGDCVTFTVPFEAKDNSDKLRNKIITNIERNAYRLVYAIDEGEATDTPPAEDPESIRVENPPKTVKKVPVAKTMAEADKMAAERDTKAKKQKEALLDFITHALMDPKMGKAVSDIIADAKKEYNTDTIDNMNIDRLIEIRDRIQKEVA